MEKAKSEIQLKSIFLLNSSFNRGSYLDTPNIDGQELKVSMNTSARENFLDIKVEVRIGEKVDADQVYVQTTMLGIFEKVKETIFSDEEFGNINAPAIIYPYIRQHIRSLSLDAGLNPIVLPLINFQKLYEHKLQKS